MNLRMWNSLGADPRMSWKGLPLKRGALCLLIGKTCLPGIEAVPAEILIVTSAAFACLAETREQGRGEAAQGMSKLRCGGLAVAARGSSQGSQKWTPGALEPLYHSVVTWS